MRVQTLLVVRSILVFDAVLVFVVGSMMAYYMDKPPGLLFGAACWLLSGMLFGGVRYADHLYDHRG